MLKDFSQPHEVSDALMVFPAGPDLLALYPEYEDIPEDFKDRHNPWVEWQSHWFYKGLSQTPPAKEGISAEKAYRHLNAMQRTFQTRHEHKQSAVAYLGSLWFTEPLIVSVEAKGT